MNHLRVKKRWCRANASLIVCKLNLFLLCQVYHHHLAEAMKHGFAMRMSLGSSFSLSTLFNSVVNYSA